jgi:hypothetical protein
MITILTNKILILSVINKNVNNSKKNVFFCLHVRCLRNIVYLFRFLGAYCIVNKISLITLFSNLKKGGLHVI